jgi:small conductance mechanosensitive channel
MNWDWKKFYNQAMDWVINYGPRVIIGVLVFIVGLFLVRLLNKWVRKSMQRGRLNPSVRYFLQNLLAINIQILLVILVLQIIGLQLTVVSAIIAGLTVAVGLALSGTLQNFVSGILILVLKPYQVGDNINTQGPAPRIGVSLLDADRYTVTVNVWTNAHGYYDTRVSLNEKIVNDLMAAGVKFPGM